MVRLVAWILALTFALPGSALAVDGVLEINQTCATQTGCFPGDTAGFPVTISVPGSYRLTGSLLPSSNPSCIVITSSDVTLDLNEFRIGPFLSGALGSGINAQGQTDIHISNGPVSFFGAFGIVT